MILHECEQGSLEWQNIRLGIPTASQFHRIVQPGGTPRLKKNGEPYKSQAGELAESRWTYAYELVAERLLKIGKNSIADLPSVRRGKMLESDAMNHFRIATDFEVAQAGFITPDHGRYGCSPDGLVVGELSGVELKAPEPPKHLEYFHEGPGTDYRCQYQGSLLTTGFDAWWFMSYHEYLPEALYRFERDEPFIKKLEVGLDQFCDEVDEIEHKVRVGGFRAPSWVSVPSDMNAVADIIRTGNWGG